MIQLIHWEPWQLVIQWGLIITVVGALLWSKWDSRRRK